jgi:hypothetical protein
LSMWSIKKMLIFIMAFCKSNDFRSALANQIAFVKGTLPAIKCGHFMPHDAGGIHANI